MSESTPYDELAGVIELELAAVAARDLDALGALKRRRGTIVRSLPARPPASARAALERCAVLQRRVGAELEHLREELLVDLRRLQDARRTAGAYAAERPARMRVSACA